jgi:hypothetical protein
MDTKAALLVKDLVTGEFFPALSMSTISELQQSSAMLRWVRIWDGYDYHVVKLQIPNSSFLGIVLSWADDKTLWRSKLFSTTGYPVSISFCKVGSDNQEFDVGVLMHVREVDAYESSGVVEYDIDLKLQTPLALSEIIENWKEEYESWQQSDKKFAWENAKPLENGV